MTTIINRSFIICLFTLLFFSCKKETDPPGVASLTIVNAVTGSTTLVSNFRSEGHLDYSKAARIPYKRYMKSVLEANAGQHRLRFFPFTDTTDKGTLFDLRLDLPLSSMHTLFLAGTMDAPESVMISDAEIPFYPAGDSTMGIRFINLSKGSAPVNVNITGLADGSEVTGLTYKSITSFKRYPVSQMMQDYVFEFRDAATGTVLASYTTLGLNQTAPNSWVFRNFTVALTGKPGETGALAPVAFLVEHR